MPWYKTGTVALTLNSTTITGTGTAFDANVRVGDMFRAPNGATHEITNVASATVISISPAYAGATASGQAYSIVPVQGYPKDLVDQVKQMISDFSDIVGNANLGAFADLAGAANYIPYFTGAGAMSLKALSELAKAGPNSDITALSGLTTALSIAQGGTGAKTLAAAQTALGVTGPSTTIGANVNLNTLRTGSKMAQPSAANATLALNYPVALPGSLVVDEAAGGAVTQTYRVYSTGMSYTRGYDGTSTWSAWTTGGLTGSLPINQGGTGATTAEAARNNLSCAGLARTTTGATVPSATLTWITFDSEVMDSNGLVNLSTDTTYLTVPETGLYMIYCSGDLAGVTSPATGSIANLRVADAAGALYLLVAAPWSGANANQMSGTGLAYLTAGAKLRMGVYQTSGSSTTIRGTASYSGYFGMAKVG